MANSSFVGQTDDFDTEAYVGSFQQILSTTLGATVTCDFLVGTNMLVSKTGILEAVGNKYVVLLQRNNTYVVCDIFNLKFVTYLSLADEA